MKNEEHPSTLWARFRFAIIGPLLAAPPEHGELAKQISLLSEKTWTHPIDGQPYKVSLQTIERWLYQARATHDPVGALRRKVRTDSGRFASVTTEMVTQLDKLYREYPTWSYQLHYDNLKSLARADPKIGDVPSYPTVRRFMKSQGWVKKKRRGDAK
ncbi:helix-turn-helix domain-containing protein, partial [Myxococcota bacterium]|nr:helix-turn-helix domain-containing protein [Myxococcota bacterium]